MKTRKNNNSGIAHFSPYSGFKNLKYYFKFLKYKRCHPKEMLE